MKTIWNYISDVWQGDDGKLSIKRLLVITLVIEVVRMLENGKVNNEQMLSAFYALLGTIILTLGIITVSQIQTLRFGQIFKSETHETTTITSTTDTTTIPPQ